MTIVSDKQKEATSLIVEQLVQSGIKLVASLPDDWIAPLIDAVDKDDRFKHVPVNREESAIGLCSGAYFGGIPSLALMGASGLTTCVYAITKINYSYHIPVFIFATLRGVIGDPTAASHFERSLPHQALGFDQPAVFARRGEKDHRAHPGRFQALSRDEPSRGGDI